MIGYGYRSMRYGVKNIMRYLGWFWSICTFILGIGADVRRNHLRPLAHGRLICSEQKFNLLDQSMDVLTDVMGVGGPTFIVS